jgi:teichuronic acid biosynthesis glycosyltransferase TuaC
MKLAVVTQHFPSSTQPSRGQTAYQVLRLLARQHDVQVFYPVIKYPVFLPHPGKDRPPVDLSWAPPEVKTSYIQFRGVPALTRPINGLLMAHSLLPHVRKFAPDVVLNYDIFPDGDATVRIARALDIPSVLTAVGSDLNRIPDPLCAMLTRAALRNADFVATVSHDLCKTARSMGADPARSRATLNGCDAAVFHPRDRNEARLALGLTPDEEAIVYIGRMDFRKGLVELIDAVAQLVSHRPNLRCYMVGDGSDEPLLRQQIATHNLEAQIKIMPVCPSDQIAVWMAAATLITLPSYAEGCPNVIVEALASGRPVVATNVGGIPELMDETAGVLVPPKDVPALVKGLDKVLSKTWDASAISSVHTKTWHDMADEVYQILEEAIRDHKRS